MKNKKVITEATKPITIEGSIEDLKVQLQEYNQKSEYYIIMKHKAQGALEALMQIENSQEKE